MCPGFWADQWKFQEEYELKCSSQNSNDHKHHFSWPYYICEKLWVFITILKSWRFSPSHKHNTFLQISAIMFVRNLLHLWDYNIKAADLYYIFGWGQRWSRPRREDREKKSGRIDQSEVRKKMLTVQAARRLNKEETGTTGIKLKIDVGIRDEGNRKKKSEW